MKNKSYNMGNEKYSSKKDDNNALTPEFTKPPETEEKDTTKPIGFFKLFRYATSLDKTLIFFGLVSAIITGVIQPMNNLLFGTLTGQIIEYAFILQNGTDAQIKDATDEFFTAVTDFAIYNSLIGLGMLIFSYFQTELFNYSALRQIFKIRCLYLERVLNQDISWYDINHTGEFSSRISDDLTKLEDGIGEKVPIFLNFQAGFLTALILALIKGWELALICLCSLPAAVITLGVISFITSKFAKKEQDAYAAAGAISEEVFSSVRTVLAFGGQEKEAIRYAAKVDYARKNNIKRQLSTALSFGLIWFLIYCSYALAFWYGVKLILDQKDWPVPDYDPATMVTVFFSVMTGSMNFGISSPYIEAFGIARGSGTKIFQVIDNIPVINLSKNKGDVIDNIKGNIRFKNIQFSYPSRKDVPILQGLDLEIKSGETVALVGSSGCGKSTCVQLIQRFYDPNEGQVLLDGKDLKDLNLTWLRDNIGVVGQEPVLFGTTIEENIRYGNRSASSDDIKKAAAKANAYDFIMALPEGFNTLVGERGAQLSGGQKQRIAIARALVKNPAILLLDEATSALDMHSEAKVQAAIDNASKECTTVIVAHRLSTIRGAHKIVVISQGQVVEQGVHDELMALKNHYYKLVTTQVSSSDYIEHLDKKGSIDEELEDMRKLSVTEHVSEEDVASEQDEQSKKNPSIWPIFKMSAADWPYILVGIIASVGMGCSMPLFAVLFGDLLGVLSDPDDDYVRSETNKYCLYFVLAGAVVGLAMFCLIYMFSIAGEKLTSKIRIVMFRTILKQEIGWFDRKENGVGALCARLSGEAAHVQGATGQRIGTILQALSTLGLAIGLSMYYEWRLGLVALTFTPFILVATFFQGRLMMKENEGHHASLQESTKIAVEAVSNVRTIASLGCEDIFYQNYVNRLLPHQKISKRNSHFRGIVFGLARSLMYFAFSVCMYYGGILIKDDGLDYTRVFKVSQALIMGTVSIANALAFSPNLQKGITAAGRVIKLLNRVPKIKDDLYAKDTEWSDENINYSQVVFMYPTRQSVTVLKGLDLSILSGKTVALVGASGCGKSTIIQLIERFYDPNDGKITIGNEDIRNIKLESHRSKLGIVSQEPILFDRSIGENIAYGDNYREVTKAEIIEAAKKANIHNFITSLPLGYDTNLGEKGTQLSGGQKQRVAIARALMRNPKVLLLDEATSALDTESEKVVQEALDQAKLGRTCITIAHRLSTIQDADVICVIDQGKVAEMGTHNELLDLGNLYYNLHSLQNKK